jgi:PAS domain S-box-containing protein
VQSDRDELSARLAAIVASSDDAIVSKDLRGIILTWNRGAERLFGFTAEEAIGRHITLIIPEERHAEEDHVLAQVIAGIGIDHYETVRRRKDGALVDISLTVSPIRGADGKIFGASKVARDITEQKRLRHALEEANRAKDQFLAMLSHELRTPLNSVLGYTAMLRSHTLPKDQQAKALEVIERNTVALSQLVNDLIETSRITTGKLRLNLQPSDVGLLVQEAIESVRPAFEAKGLQFESEILANQIINGDPDRLRQVFWNVLSNAVKFTPAGGRVTVSVAPVDQSVRISVQDTGIGLTPESLTAVFQRFWQATGGDTGEHGGLGLGLALARHFVELHGGQITAHSPGLGKGATFEILLPVCVLVGADSRNE